MMTHEEMIAMAREAGCVEASHPFNPWSVSQDALERFAKLVLANTDPKSFMSYHAGVEAGQLAERERCALVCEEFNSCENIAQKCAAAIRKGE